VDETTYRTLTALSRNIGRPLSITGLVHEIRRLHKSAYYANIYHAVRGLMRDGVLESSRIGRSSAVSLNLTAYPVTDLLAETEIRQKRAILASDPAARGAFTDLEGAFRRHGVEFACATQIQRNLRLRRLELLLVVGNPDDAGLADSIASVATRENLRIDWLGLTLGEFLDYVSSARPHPIPEMLGESNAFFLPQLFWGALSDAALQGRRVTFWTPTDLRKLGRSDLLFNLGHFGHGLFGGSTSGKTLCVEAAIIAALLAKERRLRAGSAVLMAKNRFSPRLLAFLAAKYAAEGRLAATVQAMKGSEQSEVLRAFLRRSGARPEMEPRQSRRKSLEVHGVAG